VASAASNKKGDQKDLATKAPEIKDSKAPKIEDEKKSFPR
jgi:hypothetical protein